MGVERARPDRLAREEYDAVLDAASTYREVLVVRLAGEVGLRPSEMARLRPADVRRVTTDPPRYLLSVPEDDGRRDAYLPTAVERELRRYVHSNDVGDDERIFPITPRRIQMIVSEVAETAAELRGRPGLAELSTRELRRRFAGSALVDHGIDPQAVKAAGGWHSFEALEHYLPAPTAAGIVEAFEPLEDGPASVDGDPDDDSAVRSLLAVADRCSMIRLDEEGYVDRWNRGAASTFGYRADEVLGTHLSTFYTEEDVERGVPERTLSAAADGGVETVGRRLRKDGSTFLASEVVAPIRNDGGHGQGFAALVVDVSGIDAGDDRGRFEPSADGRPDASDRELTATIASIGPALTDAVLDATSHAAIEAGVCETVVDSPRYPFAWIDRRTVSGERPERRAVRGVDPSAVEGRPAAADGDAVSLSVDHDVSLELPDGGRFSGAIAAVPLVRGGTVYGHLRVGSDRPEAFDADEREWLETVGRQIGAAITAVRRRNLLLSDRLLELEFVCRDDAAFLTEVTERLGCRFELDSLVALSESTQLQYLRLLGANPGTVFELVADAEGVADCRLIEGGDDDARLEFVVEDRAPSLTLAEYGATVRELTAEDGELVLVAECAADADLRTIVDGLRCRFPDIELRGKREVERSVGVAREFREGLEDRLTDRQEATLRAAYFGGYYDWPRESTAEELADAMGISSPTLHNHLRKAQHELIRTFFDASSVDDEGL